LSWKFFRSPSGQTEMNKTVRNERRKLTASLLNSIATALMAAGGFAPVPRKSTVLGRIVSMNAWFSSVPPFALQ
jgi:hypothetical protein